MNKVYKVIWNAATGTWVAVSELGKAKTKTKSVTLAVATALAVVAGSANAADSVVEGTGATAGAEDSVVIGTDAKAPLKNSVAIGKGAFAESAGDIAIGDGAHAFSVGSTGDTTNSGNQSSIAIGVGAKADAWKTVAVGTGAAASAEGSTSLGNDANATGVASTALGEKADATGQGSTAAGRGATATEQATTAVGNNAKATGLDASAYGDGATASGQASTASGRLAEATGSASTATGQGSKATEVNSTATGSAAQATGANSSATGFNSQATGEGATATGAGSQATETNTTATGSNSKATGNASSSYGTHSEASGTSSTALGQNAKATAQNTSAVGTNAQATADFATATGTNSQATGWGSTATGVGAEASGISSSAYGRDSLAAYRATAVGASAEAAGSASVAAGFGSKALAAGTVAVGENSQAIARDAVAIGHNAVATDANSVVLGTNSGAAPYTQAPDTTFGAENGDGESYTYDAKKYAGNSGLSAGDYVSIGAVGHERQLKNLAAGVISSTSTDGVNGSQLYAVMDRVESIARTGFNVGQGDTANNVNVGGDTTNATAVGLQSNLDFNNGTLTVASVTVVPNGDHNDAKVVYDVVTQDLATDSTDGKAAVGTNPAQAGGKPQDAANPNALTTAQNVADAINASGWKVQGNGEDKDIVNPGDVVNFANGSATTAVVTSENGVTTVKYDLNVDEVTTRITNGSFAVKTTPLTTTGTPEAGDQVTTTTDPNAIATAGDVVNAVNSARETVVSKDNTVTVTKAANAFGGTEYDLSVKTDSTTTKFNNGTLEVATATIAPADAATGVVAPANTANGTIATAADVVNAINSAGWVVANTDGTTSVVNAGDKVVHADGTGTTADVVTEGDTTTVKYNVNTDNGVTTKVDPNTNAVVVATGSITPADPNTGKLAEGDTTNGTIATVGDVVNAINSAGWTTKNSDGTTAVINAGDAVNYENGRGTVANVTTVDGVTTVKYDLDADSTTIQVDPETGKLEAITSPITQTGSTVAGNQASVATNPNALVTAGEVVNAVNSARETVTSVNNTVIVTPSKNTLGGTNYDLAVRVDGNTVQINNKGELVANAVINLQDGINTKVTQVETADGTRVYQIDANKDLKDINSIQLNGKDGANGANGATLTTAQGPAGVDGAAGETKTRIVYQPLDANGNPVVDANGNPVTEQVATLNDGLKFVGDDGQVVVKKLNETLTVKGNSGSKALTDGNIGVVNENGNMIVKLAKDVNLGANSSLTANTVNVAGADGSNVAMTTNRGPSYNTAGQADGGTVNVLNVGTATNPTRLAGVANGEISANSRDAINGSQLHGAVTNINNRIDDLDQNRKAGAASAMAAAGLPQAYREGQSGVVAALGQYQGETGVAVGFTSISDNGKWLFRGAYATNTQNEHSGNLGLGYFW